MVSEINRTVVDPSEQLADSVYHYDAGERIFELGSKYEERRDAVDTQRNQPSSVLEDLRGKQKEAAAKPRTPQKAATHETTL